MGDISSLKFKYANITFLFLSEYIIICQFLFMIIPQKVYVPINYINLQRIYIKCQNSGEDYDVNLQNL